MYNLPFLSLISFPQGEDGHFVKHGSHFELPIIEQKVLNISQWFYYLPVKNSLMYQLSKYLLKIPPSYPQISS